MKPEIFIRADGGASIGLGHIVRCSALAHMLKDDFNITFFCITIPVLLKQEFEHNDFKVRAITTEKDFLGCVSADNIIILDGYNFDIEYQRQIKAIGCKLVFIDDLHNQEIVADLIINHTPGISPLEYNTLPYTGFALGLDYVLLRSSFLKRAEQERQNKNIEAVLISFGGADPEGLTKRTLLVAIQFSSFKKIIVVTGASFKDDHEFRAVLKKDKRIDYRHELGEQEMANTMVEADLAILPASGVLYEALVAGCQVISGQYVDNQRLVYDNLKNANLFYDAGNFNEAQLKLAIENVVSKPSSVKKIIDGRSGERLRKIFETIKKEDSVQLRKAQKEDLLSTYKWALDPAIRRYSFQQHQITLQEHSAWFLGKVNDPNCRYFIGENNGKPIGSIRFDIINNEALISFLVDPVIHGQGFGLVMLRKGIEKLINEDVSLSKRFEVISGYVLKPNISSIKSFERLGFEKTEYPDKLKFTKQILLRQ